MAGIKPFVKWAGGKTQLLEDIRRNIPGDFQTYYEPFLGGGAVLLDLKPRDAIVSDANPELIGAYKAIKSDVYVLMDAIDEIDGKGDCSDELYYKIREKYNEEIKAELHNTETAAYLIWLNHHCFNGLYRTNKTGAFNTPWNKCTSYVAPYDRDNLIEISDYFNANNVQLVCEDYKDALKRPQAQDFVFLDPPYVPVGQYGDFKRYTKAQFYEDDQRQLAVMVKELVDRGVNICLTNSNTKLVQTLYKDFKIEIITTHRNINSKGNARIGEDAIITA